MKKSIYILEPLVVYIIMHDVVQFLLYLVINRIVAGESVFQAVLRQSGPYVTSGVQVFSMLSGMLGLMVFEKAMEKRRGMTGGKTRLPETTAGSGSGTGSVSVSESTVTSFKSCTAAEQKRYCVRTAAAALQMLMLSFALNVLMLNTGFGRSVGGFAEVSNHQNGTPPVMAVLLFGIVSPLAEEYVFRGMLYVRLKEIFPVILSLGISALFFGIYHGNIVQGIYGFLMGLFLAYVYESFAREKLPSPFFTVVLCHALANLFIYFSGRYGLIERVSVPTGVILLLGTLVSLTLCR